MKKVQLLIILLLFSLSGYSQITGFAVINNKLVWENVFVATQQNIPALIERNSRLKIMYTDGKMYKGTGTNVLYKCGDNSNVFKNGYNFNFGAELVEGKYRITVTNINFNTKAKTTAEKHFIEAGKIKQDELTIADLSCLQLYFDRVFSVSTVLKNKS
jgi:hypothetical protein